MGETLSLLLAARGLIRVQASRIWAKDRTGVGLVKKVKRALLQETISLTLAAFPKVGIVARGIDALAKTGIKL